MGTPKVRFCKLAGCTKVIPWNASGPRKFCSEVCRAAHAKRRKRTDAARRARRHMDNDDAIDTIIEVLHGDTLARDVR